MPSLASTSGVSLVKEHETVQFRDHGAHDVMADPEAGALVAEQPA